MEKSKRWVQIALVNLTLVALLGAIMRYKIGFSLPFLDQKFLQEAHSHFAFAGWITHTLYFLIVNVFRTNIPAINELRYHRLIQANLLSAYGMLIAFAIQGYGPVSLVFATLSVLTGYVFSWFALKDTSKLSNDHPGKNWIKAGIWFGIFSTIGTMVLSWMMSTKAYDQNTYLGSIYFYLHFQYNGWFLFGCLGIFMDRIKHMALNRKHVRISFLCMVIAGIPAYFLSILWIQMPVWLYGVVVAAAFLQIFGWWFFIRLLRHNLPLIKESFSRTVLLLFLVVAMALTLKLFLQLGSTVPAISKLAFSFRPIVIAYLHLVLLLIVTVFLLAFLYGTGLMRSNKLTLVGILAFTVGAILNELVLAIQGIYAFSYTVVPFVNQILFAVALVLLSSAFLLASSQFRSSKI